jgi:hypothetical protein
MTEALNLYDSNGERHGVWEKYHEDGTLMWRGYYLHGKLHRVEWHYPDGTPRWRGNYLHGNQHGVSERYKEDGTLWMKNYFLRIK